MIGSFLVSLVIPFLLGYAIVFLLMPRSASFSSFLFRCLLGPGVGIGISSCLYFVWLILTDAPVQGFAVIETLVAVVLAGLGVLKAKRQPRAPRAESVEISTPEVREPWLLNTCLGFAATLCCFAFCFHTVSWPNGGIDAIHTWTFRASFIFRAGESWRDAFSTSFVQTDYPLLIPLTLVRCWSYMGSESWLIPPVIAALFAVLTAGLLIISIRVWKGAHLACLGGLFLLGTPLFTRIAAVQQADIPLAYYLLATFSLVVLHSTGKWKGNGVLVLTGVTAGLAAWTKNEGLLFVLAFGLGRGVMVLRPGGCRALGRELMWLGAGLLPVMLVILSFKQGIASANYLFDDSISPWTKLMDFQRYIPVMRAFAVQIPLFGGGLLVLLALVVALSRYTKKPEVVSTASNLAIVIVIMLTGYFFIYVVTSSDQQWHISTSLYRLLLQLWPSVIFLALLLPKNLPPARWLKR